MPQSFADVARKYFQKEFDELHALEQRAVTRLVHRTPPSPVAHTPSAAGSFGERLADRVAEFGGSWRFIILFGVVLVGWIVGNIWLLATIGRTAFDPYPFIFLNLVLSMLAALQAPVIMMSQNRQSQLDRRRAENDYEINLKAELEIIQLHEKLDELRETRWQELMAVQERQLALLAEMVKKGGAS